MREEYLALAEEKNQEIVRVKNKFKDLMEGQLTTIHTNMDSQDQKFKLEMDGLRNILEIKNG
jgi:hypothetical protein